MKETYIHELKCHPPYFQATKRGDKTFEIRKEDRERKFTEGDVLHLREFEPCVKCGGTGMDSAWTTKADSDSDCECMMTDSPKGHYTDSETLEYVATYIMRGPQFGLQEGWVIMGLGAAGKIAGLKHGAAICDSKNLSMKNTGYRAACDEIKVCLEAAIERVQAGEQMEGVSYVQ